MTRVIELRHVDAVSARDRKGLVVTSNARILLVEDDPETAEEVILDLTERGYAMTHVVSGLAALECARDGDFDLLIVDRMLPELDGLSVIETLRRDNLRVPFLVLSALGAVEGVLRDLRAKGGDYLTKPFSLVELAARAEALLRRPALDHTTRLQVGSLELDLIERKANRAGRPIDLVPGEFRLLEYLMRRTGQVLTRNMLLEGVWNYRFSPRTNLVDVHIGKLQRKIDGPGEPPLIRDVGGIGFVLCDPD